MVFTHTTTGARLRSTCHHRLVRFSTSSRKVVQHHLRITRRGWSNAEIQLKDQLAPLQRQHRGARKDLRFASSTVGKSGGLRLLGHPVWQSTMLNLFPALVYLEGESVYLDGSVSPSCHQREPKYSQVFQFRHYAP